eukprot:1064486-Prorocentrum_lima.AAC.1
MFWQQGWLQDTYAGLEEGWIVNAFGERVRVNLLWQRRALGSIQEEVHKALRLANWDQAKRLLHGAVRCAVCAMGPPLPWATSGN